jgi:glycosyltransferase involved in cell wall biosynthesis
LVAVESMAAGTPVVASDIGGLAEVIGDGCSGALVAPGRPDDLAAALDMLLGEPALRAQVAAEGRRRAADFTASAVLPAVFDAYSAALAHRTGARGLTSV